MHFSIPFFVFVFKFGNIYLPISTKEELNWYVSCDIDFNISHLVTCKFSMSIFPFLFPTFSIYV